MTESDRQRRVREFEHLAFQRGLIEKKSGSSEINATESPDSATVEPGVFPRQIRYKADAHILIVDDDDQFRTMLRKMLEAAGYENIIEASDGKRAIKIYAENPTHLIITDMVMPEMLGIDTIIQIKRDFPEARIVAISGGGWFGPEIDLDMAAKLGVRTFEKPIERQKFLQAISDLLNLS